MANKPLSAKSLEILKALEKGTFTAAEIANGHVEGVNSAHFTALVNRGLVSAEKVEVEVPTIVKRKVNAYTITEKGASFKVEGE